MNQKQMNPLRTAWQRGRCRKVGAWKFSDETFYSFDFDKMVPCRIVWHYGKVMGYFAGSHMTTPLWSWVPVSVGLGSVSDQQGCNRIVAGLGGWYFQRAGGSKWVQR